ncbi:MAG: penicillin-binding protein 1B [Acidiferrobacterales bacterium]|nr:penicillin-binding protein 1B [Acidiferrobacterales bacterium]
MKKRKLRFKGLLRSLLIRFTVWAVSLTAIGAVAGFLWIDHQVRERFDRQLWDIPVHIYSRATEIYPGLPISADQLERRLRNLGYRTVADPKQPGEFSKDQDTIDLVSREFQFWDGQRSSMSARISIDRDRIAAITDRKTGSSISLIRLKPVLIGSLSQLQHEDRSLQKLEEMPRLLLTTLVAVEDRNFTQHRGVDLQAILRAAWVNLTAGRIVQGGSTLTQQLIKNIYGRDERTYQRKLLEIAMAVVMEFRLEKHQILEAYCNEVFLGQDGKRAIHGFGLGSQFLFGRPLSELNAAEIAQLVGMIKAPSAYNPLRNPQRAQERRDLVLNIMSRDGLISQDTFTKHVNKPLDLATSKNRVRREFASFSDVVLRQLSGKISAEGFTEGDFSVFTTMDIEVQRAAEKSLAEELTAIERQRGIPSGTLEGAVVVIRPDDGEVLAIAGGRTGYVGTFNRAIDAHRPIGSLIKPIVYLSAFMEESKWTLGSLVADERFSYRTENGQLWSPQNYDEEFLGDITILEALAKSRNIPAVRVGTEIGVDSVAGSLSRLGIEIKGPVYPSMLLGTLELSPMQVVQMYQALANYGYLTGLRAISTIADNSGNKSIQTQLRARSAIPAEQAYLALFAMQEAVSNGTGRRLLESFPAALALAGKTGTTDDYRDSWFVGISGNMLGAVWVGRDDNRPVGLTGANGALVIWSSMMKHLNLQPLEPGVSESIEFVDIDPRTGYRAGAGCSDGKRIPFLNGTAPNRVSNCDGAG